MDKEALVYRRTIADLSASIKHFQHDFHDLAKHIQVRIPILTKNQALKLNNKRPYFDGCKKHSN
jgi:hypothetical protein